MKTLNLGSKIINKKFASLNKDLLKYKLNENVAKHSANKRQNAHVEVNIFAKQKSKA